MYETKFQTVSKAEVEIYSRNKLVLESGFYMCVAKAKTWFVKVRETMQKKLSLIEAKAQNSPETVTKLIRSIKEH